MGHLDLLVYLQNRLDAKKLELVRPSILIEIPLLIIEL